MTIKLSEKKIKCQILKPLFIPSFSYNKLQAYAGAPMCKSILCTAHVTNLQHCQMEYNNSVMRGRGF